MTRRPCRHLRAGAPAKINLDLRVLRRRPDGYHDVRTMLQSIALRDVLSLTVRPGPLRVWCRRAAVPSGPGNLVWTATRLLWRALDAPGEPHGVSIGIVKRVPMAAGLGGASSDAASALRLLGRLWGVPAATLDRVAAAVGSDVPFFLRGGTVLATGRGERTRPLQALAPHWVVLARPGYGVSTPSAYGWWDRDTRGPHPSRAPADWRRRLDRLRNDLEPPVVRRHPDIGDMVTRFAAAGAVAAAMTGSGSTVCGLFPRAGRAARARRAIRCTGWRTWLTRTIGRTEFGRLAAPACID